jgi:hypothetical protein
LREREREREREESLQVDRSEKLVAEARDNLGTQRKGNVRH